MLTFGRDTDSSQKGSKVKDSSLHALHLRELRSCPTKMLNRSESSSVLYHCHHSSGLAVRGGGGEGGNVYNEICTHMYMYECKRECRYDLFISALSALQL